MTRQTLIKRFPYFKRIDFEHAIDNLTGVFTRDVICGYMQHLIQSGTPFSLFIADVDNFKYVNDRYGHHEGDEVLACVAKFLSDILGKRGVVGRFGGDEFLLVCEGITDYNGVWAIGHEINLNIGNLKFRNEGLSQLTLTMGVARYPVDAVDYDEFFNLADKALYIGKSKGRNRFIIYLESKHKSLDFKSQREMAFSPTYLHSKLFSTLTGSDNLAAAIKSQLVFLASYNMYDHICIETEAGIKFNILHAQSRVKNFKPMKLKNICRSINSVGLVSIKITEGCGELLGENMQNALEAQAIKSSAYCSITAYGKTYGYIRVDMTATARIWQNDELAILVDTAKTIGILLHYNNTTIDELDSGEETEIVGKKQS